MAVRIERPPYFADIVQDSRTTPAKWHCIIQRQGSSEVIAWFQEATQNSAEQAAAVELENLHREDLARAGQLPLILKSGPDHAA